MTQRNSDVLAGRSERSSDHYEREIVEALRSLGDRLFASRNFDKRDFWAVREAAVLIEERAREAARSLVQAPRVSLVTPVQHRQAAEAFRAIGWADLARRHEQLARSIECASH
jgi:hypothetical protein